MTDFPKIFCAIDTVELKDACALARKVAPVTGGIKIGLEFFNAHGPQGVERVLEVMGTAQLFLDLKFHDIPNTVAGAVRGICRNFAPAYLNVHASGGAEMMAAAKDACAKKTKMLGVTVLTSMDSHGIEAVGFRGGVPDQVERLARLAQKSGLDGVVCSAHEIESVQAVCRDDFILMVPGIRPEGAAKGDQKRVMSPSQALAAGATHLVIGRPITQASDPARAAEEILESL